MEVVSVFGGYLRVFPLQYRALKYHLLQNESSDTKKKKRKKNGGCGVSPPTLKLWEPLSPTIRLRGPQRSCCYSPPFPCLTVVGRERGAGTSSTQIVVRARE